MNKEAYVTFGGKISQENLTCGFDNLIKMNVSKCGKQGLYFKAHKTENLEALNNELYFSLSDNVKADDYTLYELEVTYHDEGVGNFRIIYDGIPSVFETSKKESKVLRSEIVKLTDSKEWRTHKFLLENARFKKGYPKNDTFDFAISLYEKNMGLSRDGITFSKISIKPIDKKSTVLIKLSSDNLGNNFFKEENVKIYADFVNVTDKTQNVKACFSSKNVFGKSSYSQEFDLSLPAGEKSHVCLEFMPEYSVFDGLMEVIADGVYSSDKIQYAYSFSTNKKNKKLGINSHSNRLPNRDYRKLIPLMDKVGYGNVRDAVIQEMCFGADGLGPYKMPDYNTDVIEFYKSRGINWLQIMAWFAGETGENGGIMLPENTKAYIKYVKDSAPHLKKLCHSFEIMNECNLHGFPVEWYCDVLKEIYQSMKESAPDHPVIAGVTSYIDLNFLEKMIELAPGCFDEISVHPYTFVTSPDEVFEYTFYGHVKNLREFMDKKGLSNMPITVTEIGFPTQLNFAHPELTITQMEQAAYIPQVAAIYRNPELNIKATYFYDFQSDGYNPEDLENNLGVINTWEVVDTPYLAKPALLSVAWYNEVMANATYNKRIDDERVHLYLCSIENDKSAIMLWSKLEADKMEISIDGDAKVYDLFGNLIAKADGKVTLDLDYTPKYIVGDFKNFEIK